ncbi:MAG: hypothetical protein AAFZ15_13970 [Bacteroidota bacterium]
MKKSDLYQIYLHLSSEQRMALTKFVHSPFHNLREDVKNLHLFLTKNIEKNPAAFTFEKAHTAAYPSTPFDMQQLRYCMSYLMKVIEKYFVHSEATSDPLKNQIWLANAFRKMGLEKHTRRALNRGRAIQQKHSTTEVDFYEKNYLLETEQYHYAQGMKRTAPRNLQQINNSLDLSFLAKKLKQSCLALSHGAIANVEYDTGLLNLVLDYLEQAPWLDEQPAISLYFYHYRAATTQHARYFEKMKMGILKYGYLLPNDELRNMHLLAINFCIQRFNKGEEQYLFEVFDLYKSALEKEILLQNNRISRFAFKNIAGIAIRLGEFDWTADFIDQYKSAVEPRHRRNYTDFNMAKLFYAKKDLEKAMQLLQKVEYEDVFLNLDAKILLLKIYFELNETDVLDSFINSFQRYLQRRKGLGYHRENYLNTLQFARRLISLNPFDKNEKTALKKEIEMAAAVGEREWLLEQL